MKVHALWIVLAAGCLAPTIPQDGVASCEPFPIAPATHGSRFTYATTGAPFTPSLESPLHPHIRAAHDGSYDLVVAIGDAPAPRINGAGTTESAIQVSYHARWADGFSHAFADEWVAAADGQAIQATYRDQTGQGLGLHGTRLTRADRPPLLFASAVWGGGPAPEWSYGGEIYPAPGGAIGGVEVNATATSQWVHGASGCELRLEVDLGELPLLRVHVAATATFGRDAPMPTFYKAELSGRSGTTTFEARLVSWTDGGGEPLTAWKPRPRALDHGLPSFDVEHGVVLGDFSVFPTSYFQAMHVLREHPATALWFHEHASAVAVVATHVMAVEPYVDEWVIEHRDQTGGHEARVLKKRPILPVDLWPFDHEVRASETTHALPPGFAPKSVPAASIEELALAAYGVPLEVVRCDLMEQSCYAGNHHGMNMPLAGQAAAASTRPGLYIWTETGLVLQEDSYDEAAIGPPVGPD